MRRIHWLLPIAAVVIGCYDPAEVNNTIPETEFRDEPTPADAGAGETGGASVTTDYPSSYPGMTEKSEAMQSEEESKAAEAAEAKEVPPVPEGAEPAPEPPAGDTQPEPTPAPEEKPAGDEPPAETPAPPPPSRA